MPAGLLLILLLRAGIKRNPGPTSAGKTRTKINWACSVCCQNIPKTKCYVQCNKCTKCVHLSCSGLSISAKWSTIFTGPCCMRRPSAPSLRTPTLTPCTTIYHPTNQHLWATREDQLQHGLHGQMQHLHHCHAGYPPQAQHLPEVSSGYSIICTDRPSEMGKGGGLAFIIHQDIHHRVHNLTSTDVHL